MAFFIKYFAILAAAVLFVFAALGIGRYQYRENRALAKRLSLLERQIALLAQALQEANVIGESYKQQLRELSSRGQVVARSQDELLTAAVATASPAVVSIVISKDVPLLEVRYANPFGNDPMFDDIGIRIPTYRQVGTKKQKVGAGTGFVIRSDGYVLTNKHVVDDVSAEYTILLSTGEQMPAEVVHRDSELDIAIVKIAGIGHPSISLGNSVPLKLGQTVVAIGNALGEYGNSASVGIISGLDRTIHAQDPSGAIETLTGVIQTDAAINRGNSGGPLLDLTGAAIGVNVAIERGANNIAFAIPVSAVKPIINRVLP